MRCAQKEDFIEGQWRCPDCRIGVGSFVEVLVDGEGRGLHNAVMHIVGQEGPRFKVRYLCQMGADFDAATRFRGAKHAIPVGQRELFYSFAWADDIELDNIHRVVHVVFVTGQQRAPDPEPEYWCRCLHAIGEAEGDGHQLFLLEDQQLQVKEIVRWLLRDHSMPNLGTEEPKPKKQKQSGLVMTKQTRPKSDNGEAWIILDLCGGTGNWSAPYRKAGFDVRVITTPQYDVMTYEAYKDRGVCRRIYGILAAPPCTLFSMARTTKVCTPEERGEALKLVNRCMEIIQYCKLHGSLRFWALENPKGHLERFLGRPPLVFNAWQYGAEYMKPTHVWGYFRIPEPTVVERPAHLYGHEKRPLPQLPKDYEVPLDTNPRSMRRAMTYPGFAEEFFKANR